MDKVYIKSKVQKIMDKEFTSTNRRRIVEYDGRYNFCCPYCGDGKSEYKKRCNLYLNKLLIVCFNCDKRTNFDKMCKDFNEMIDPGKKLEMIESLSKNITYEDYNDSFTDTKIEDLIEMNELIEYMNSSESYYSEFQPIIENGGIYKYLLNRGIKPELHKNIYQAKILKNENYEWVICMLNRKDDKVLGMQVRNLKEGRNRWFKIYNYENLLHWTKGEDFDIDINKLVIYNKLSYFFNILNVNMYDTITVFEGYIDSMFYPNSIGLVGVGTDTNFIENNGLDIQYFFDNDDAGYRKSEQKLKGGFKVFLWKKLFEDIVEKKKTNDPSALMHRISKVKDLNKLANLINKPYSTLKLSDFYSKDILDLKWIPKISMKRKTTVNETQEYNNKFKNFDKL